MSPMGEIRDRAKEMLEAGDSAGALKLLQDALVQMEAQPDYDLMAKWTLLDDQVRCLEAMGNREEIKRVRAEQARVAMAYDSKRATGEIRSRHVVTDDKKDLPGLDRGPEPKPEDDRRG